jgi:hypothetical protein
MLQALAHTDRGLAGLRVGHEDRTGVPAAAMSWVRADEACRRELT